MNREKTYILKGCPIALARGRISGAGKRHVYDSQKQLKLIAGINLRNQAEGDKYFEGPIELDVTFYIEIPKSRIKQRNLPGQYHTYVPDLSNLIKFTEDIAANVLYNNDCIISKIAAKKVYTPTNPRTQFTLRQLDIRESDCNKGLL